MKKILTVLACAAALGACTSTGAGSNATPAKLTKAVAAADRTCQTDADCVAVQKGCCPCAGFEAVNKTAADKVQKVFENACANAGCTREACYTRITTSCVNNVCTGKLLAPKAVAF